MRRSASGFFSGPVQRIATCLLVGVWCGGIGAFAQDRGSASGSRTPSRDGASVLKDYRVTALDTLAVKVFQEPDLTLDVKVSQTGYVTYPLLGKVYVAGMLVSEVENQLAAQLSRGYLKKPQVSVLIKEYSARRISVMGEVKKAGTYEIPPEERMTLLQAIAKAEGFTNIAKTDRVIIRRIMSGEEKKIEVNATELMKTDGEKKDVELQPGDIVVVDQRFF